MLIFLSVMQKIKELFFETRCSSGISISNTTVLVSSIIIIVVVVVVVIISTVVIISISLSISYLNTGVSNVYM